MEGGGRLLSVLTAEATANFIATPVLITRSWPRLPSIHPEATPILSSTVRTTADLSVTVTRLPRWSIGGLIVTSMASHG